MKIGYYFRELYKKIRYILNLNKDKIIVNKYYQLNNFLANNMELL